MPFAGSSRTSSASASIRASSTIAGGRRRRDPDEHAIQPPHRIHAWRHPLSLTSCAGWPSSAELPLFDRFAIMHYWSDEGTFDLYAATAGYAMARHVHECIGRAPGVARSLMPPILRPAKLQIDALMSSINGTSPPVTFRAWPPAWLPLAMSVPAHAQMIGMRHCAPATAGPAPTCGAACRRLRTSTIRSGTPRGAWRAASH